MFFRILITLMILTLGMPVYTSAEAPPSPLTVTPIYPDNQITPTKGYFNLSVQPGDPLTLTSSVTNNLAEDIYLKVEAANAFSSPTGGIVYEHAIESMETMLLEDAIHLADYMETEGTIKIPAGSTIEIPVQIDVPESDGQEVLGAIIYTATKEKSGESQETENDETTFVLKTETSYAIAVRLQYPNQVPADFSLGEVGFDAENAQVFIEMTNHAQLIQEEISGSYTVSDQTGIELFQGDFGSFKMAPQSQINFPFHWNHNTLEDGNYTLTVSGMAGAEEFAAEETFTIESNDVETYAETIQPTVNQSQGEGVPMWVWGIGMVAFGFIMFFIGKRRK